MTSVSYTSVVIPTYRRCASVERALRALSVQTVDPATLEVVVAIDGSEDGTRDLVATFPAPYRLQSVWQPNRGRASARNAGIRATRGDLLIMLDDDMEPVPEFVAAHRAAHEGASRCCVVGAVPIRSCSAPTPAAAYIAAKFNRHLQRLAQPGFQFNLRDFYSGNFSIRRSDLEAAGLFDEAFTIYGNEDLELSLRLNKVGVQLRYSPDALAYQHYTKDFPALARDTVAKGRTAVLLAQKHRDALAGLKLSTYHQASPRWRLARAGLLAASRVCGGVPTMVERFVVWLEHRRPERLHSYYELALDYYYWLGARAAIADLDGTPA